MVVLLEVSPISTQDLWSSARVTIGFLVTCLIKALCPQLLSLAGEFRSMKTFGGSKSFLFENDGGFHAVGHF